MSKQHTKKCYFLISFCAVNSHLSSSAVGLGFTNNPIHHFNAHSSNRVSSKAKQASGTNGEMFFKGGQRGFFHDEGNISGFFHTYDQFQVGESYKTPRKIHIYLPRNYEHTSQRYPVVYANDGGAVFFPVGARGKSWNLAHRLDLLKKSGEPLMAIIVGINPTNRDKEYTHAPVFNRDYGGLWDYTRYLSEQLKPWIDQNYRTLIDPSSTTIFGSSHGGLAAFALATTRPDSFGTAIAMSPSFWAGIDSPPPEPPIQLGDSELMKKIAPTIANPQQRPRIYLDWGLVRQGGNHNSFTEERATARGREMGELLQERFGYQLGNNLQMVEDPKGEHDEESWSKRVSAALMWGVIKKTDPQ